MRRKFMSFVARIKDITGTSINLGYHYTQPLLFAYVINLIMVLIFTLNSFDLLFYPYPDDISHIVRGFLMLQIFFLTGSVISLILFRLHHYFIARLIIFSLMLMLGFSTVILLSNRTDLDLVFLVIIPPLSYFITGNNEKWTRAIFIALSLIVIGGIILYTSYQEPLLKFDEGFYDNLRGSTTGTMLFIGFVVAMIQRYAENRRIDLLEAKNEIERAKSNLARYFSPKIAKHLEGGEGGFFEPRRQNIALLFTDIKGFTTISETLPAEKVMLMLRSFHQLAEPIIFENSGNIENYIGDAVFVSFGVPEQGEFDCTNAITTAKGLIDVIGNWNEKNSEQYGLTLSIGIGIHYGAAVIGDIGSERTAAFTAIGDSVNVASRLEGLTRNHDCAIVASHSLIEQYCKEQKHSDFEMSHAHEVAGFKPVKEEQLVKGRSGSIKIWIC